jgi:hypothetical protein
MLHPEGKGQACREQSHRDGHLDNGDAHRFLRRPAVALLSRLRPAEMQVPGQMSARHAPTWCSGRVARDLWPARLKTPDPGKPERAQQKENDSFKMKGSLPPDELRETSLRGESPAS